MFMSPDSRWFLFGKEAVLPHYVMLPPNFEGEDMFDSLRAMEALKEHGSIQLHM